MQSRFCLKKFAYLIVGQCCLALITEKEKEQTFPPPDLPAFRPTLPAIPPLLSPLPGEGALPPLLPSALPAYSPLPNFPCARGLKKVALCPSAQRSKGRRRP